ncbi:type II toxin-antitoxin system HicB family antitoxin, partial [Alphaproteobacteria bacterium]|nr:type II toxin-antitoxin system HicB family antitoxin [Alphaproteobacteria bacterium]
GGGFLARVPDLPGCFGDGETQVEAVQDASKAIVEWVDEYEKMGRDIPQPGSAADNLLAQREAEIKLINELRDRLDSSEASMAAMAGDVAVLKVRMGEIERYIKDLLDVVDNAAAWERFEIITKQTRSQQRELFVLAARS